MPKWVKAVASKHFGFGQTHQVSVSDGTLRGAQKKRRPQNSMILKLATNAFFLEKSTKSFAIKLDEMRLYDADARWLYLNDDSSNNWPSNLKALFQRCIFVMTAKSVVGVQIIVLKRRALGNFLNGPYLN